MSTSLMQPVQGKQLVSLVQFGTQINNKKHWSETPQQTLGLTWCIHLSFLPVFAIEIK